MWRIVPAHVMFSTLFMNFGVGVGCEGEVCGYYAVCCEGMGSEIFQGSHREWKTWKMKMVIEKS